MNISNFLTRLTIISLVVAMGHVHCSEAVLATVNKEFDILHADKLAVEAILFDVQKALSTSQTALTAAMRELKDAKSSQALVANVMKPFGYGLFGALVALKVIDYASDYSVYAFKNIQEFLDQKNNSMKVQVISDVPCSVNIVAQPEMIFEGARNKKQNGISIAWNTCKTIAKTATIAGGMYMGMKCGSCINSSTLHYGVAGLTGLMLAHKLTETHVDVRKPLLYGALVAGPVSFLVG